jgi:guanine deaminase
MTNDNARNDRGFLLRAIDASNATVGNGNGGPFGVVIVKDGKIIAEGGNEVLLSNDPTAHAEVVAIRRACDKLGAFSLAGATLYSSCEPCPMCLAAIYWARITRVVYANTREAAEKVGFDDALIYDEIAKLPGMRKIACEHMPLPEAKAAFEAWENKPNRVNY